jgi:histidine ammonia-lyase
MLRIGARRLTLNDLDEIVFLDRKIELDKKALKRVTKCFRFLKEFTKGKVIYGINTGFGPMAQYKINEHELTNLQLNLIRSHSSGSGHLIPDVLVKSSILARLNSLMQGYSGIHPNVVHLLKEFVNRNICPSIPEHGGVGASGDLVQLAHLALALIGEGKVSYRGKLLPTKKVLKQNDLQPISIHIREGLSLVNGTSVMTGIGVVNLIMAKNLLDWSLTASTMIVEIVEGYDDFFSEKLNGVKIHRGQSRVAELMRRILSDSKLTRKRPDHLYNGHADAEIIKEIVQHNYSIRCVPQILGPICDTIEVAERVVLDEVNSVNDNPIIDMDDKDVLHGGNFHGDYVSFEMDKLKIAVTKLSMLAERQLNFLLNDKLNNKLPPFVNLGRLGLNLGMQGAQFTATSTVAENQTLSFPMYVHSIPTNMDNQDIVSMGTNSSLLAKKVIENAYEVLSIHLIAILQAVDHLDYKKSLSGHNRRIFSELRTVVPKFTKDTVKYEDICNVKDFILNNRLNLT